MNTTQPSQKTKLPFLGTLWNTPIQYSPWLANWWLPALLLVIPTFWLLAYAKLGLGLNLNLNSDSSLEWGTISQSIEDTWSLRLLIPVIQHYLPSFELSHSHEKIWHVLLDISRLLIIGWLGILYLYGFQQFRKSPEELPSLGRLLLGVGILSGILMWVVPFHSSDLYGYINRGAQQAFLQTNPYITPVGHISHWDSYSFFHAHWLDNPCPYGFFFANIANWFGGLSRSIQQATSVEPFWYMFSLFKLSHVALHLGNMALAYVTVQYWPGQLHPEQRTQWARFSAWLVGFHPLMLLHHIANGHNDLWVSFGLMACIAGLLIARAYPNRHWLTFMAFPVLWCAILTKYAPLVALPFIILFWWHSQRNHPHKPKSRLTLWTDAISIGGLCLLVTLFLARPYTNSGEAFPWKVMLGNAGMVQHSIHSMLSRIVFYLEKIIPALSGGYALTRNGLSPVVWALFCLGYGILGIQQARIIWGNYQSHRSNEQRQHGVLFWGIGLLTLMLLVVSSKFHPWYTGMVLPAVICLAPPRLGGHPWTPRLQSALFAFSLWQLLAFTPLHNIHVLNYAILSILPLWWGWKHHWGETPEYEQNGYWPISPSNTSQSLS